MLGELPEPCSENEPLTNPEELAQDRCSATGRGEPTAMTVHSAVAHWAFPVQRLGSEALSRRVLDHW